MKKYWVLVVIFLLTITFIFAFEPDFTHNKKIEYTIKEKRNGEISLKSEIEDHYIYLTENSTSVNNFGVVEKYYAPIKDIDGSYKNDGFSFRQYRNADNYWEYDSSPHVFSSDYKTHTLHFDKELKVDDEILITYSENYWELAYLPVIDIYSGDKIEDYTIQFNHPKNYRIEFEVFFPRTEFKYSIARPDEKETTITFNNLFEEDFLDFFGYNGIYASVFIKVYRDEEELTPFSKDSFVNWYCDHIESCDSLNVDQKNILNEQIDTAQTDKEKLEIIYNYVRDNIRYIASNENNHSFFPHEPREVIKNGYGDCKDKAYLLKTLAGNYGINLNMVLLHSSVMPQIDYYNLALFDHVVCSYEDSTGIIFIDPTVEFCKFGNLPFSDYEKYALILDQNNPRYEWIPKPNSNFDLIIEIEANLDSLNKSTANIKMYNDNYILAKELNEKYMKLELENRLSNFINSFLNKISIDFFTFEAEEGDKMIYKAKADLSEFAVFTETRRYLQRTPFLVYDKNILERSEDRFDIHLNNPLKIKLDILLETGDFISKSSDVLIGDLDDDYFSSKITKKDDKYLLVYEFDNRQMNYTNEEKHTLLNLAEKYLKNKKNMIILGEEEK